jgi:hypothetical protein
MTWSGCACNWPGTAPTARRHRLPPRTRPVRTRTRPTNPAQPATEPPPAAATRPTAWPSSAGCPGRRSGRPSSARSPTCCPAPAGWPRSCAPGSSALGWPGRPCRWTSATPSRRHPQRRHPARPAVPVGGRLQPARRGLRSAPRQAQSPRRTHQPQRMRPTVLLPPPGGHSPLGLDAGAQPGRDHHGVEPRPDQGPAQPRTARAR